MKFYSLFCIIFQFYIDASTKIKLKLQRNILNFGYDINYKYEGMLVHSFDRFCVVTKFVTHNRRFKIFKIRFDDTCAYMEMNMPKTLNQGDIC